MNKKLKFFISRVVIGTLFIVFLPLILIAIVGDAAVEFAKMCKDNK